MPPRPGEMSWAVLMTGPTAPNLLPAHANDVWGRCRARQARLAEFMRTEESIIYAYDLATIPSVLPAFANAKDLIVCDEVRAWLQFVVSFPVSITKPQVLAEAHLLALSESFTRRIKTFRSQRVLEGFKHVQRDPQQYDVCDVGATCHRSAWNGVTILCGFVGRELSHPERLPSVSRQGTPNI